jgi:hypothetical protein
VPTNPIQFKLFFPWSGLAHSRDILEEEEEEGGSRKSKKLSRWEKRWNSQPSNLAWLSLVMQCMHDPVKISCYY